MFPMSDACAPYKEDGEKKGRRKDKADGRLNRSNMAFEGPGTCELLHTLK